MCFLIYRYILMRKKSIIQKLILCICLLVGYFISALHYEDIFKIGIYIRHIQACVMAILLIKLFTVIFSSTKNIFVITWLGAISMEIYLIHHLFVYDYPWYISITVTLLLAVALHVFSQKILTVSRKKNIYE
jgi:hypothetical protein